MNSFIFVIDLLLYVVINNVFVRVKYIRYKVFIYGLSLKNCKNYEK